MPGLLVGAEQWRPQDVEIVQQRIELDDLRPLSRALTLQGLGVPDDRRHEEQQLHQRGQQRPDVAIAGGQDPEAERHPHTVRHDQQQCGDHREIGPRPRFGIDDGDDHEDDDVVREQDHLPPHQPVDVHAQRGGQLFDQPLVGDEYLRALDDRGVDHVPDDQSQRHVGQVLGQLETEQLRVQQSHGDGGGAGGDGDPERAQHRSAVLLLDVLPAQVQPQLAAGEALREITPGAAHGLRLTGRIDEGHRRRP